MACEQSELAVAAYALGIAERVGSLAPGKIADVLIADVPDYRHLAYRFGANLIETVIKRGKVIPLTRREDGGIVSS